MYSIYCVPYETTRKDMGDFSHEQMMFEETYMSSQIKKLGYIYEYHMEPHQNEHFFYFKSLVYERIWKEEMER